MSADDPPANSTTLDAARDDAALAAVAAGCTVGFTLVATYVLGRDVPFAVRLLPLAPYFLSLFARRLDLGPVDAVRNWSALTLLVTLALIAFYAV